MTTATTQTPDLRFTRVRDDVAPGATAYHVYVRVAPHTWVRERGVRVCSTGTRRVLRWRATGTRGAYRTRHAAACAALAQRSATPAPLDLLEEQWADDAPAVD